MAAGENRTREMDRGDEERRQQQADGGRGEKYRWRASRNEASGR